MRGVVNFVNFTFFQFVFHLVNFTMLLPMVETGAVVGPVTLLQIQK